MHPASRLLLAATVWSKTRWCRGEPHAFWRQFSDLRVRYVGDHVRREVRDWIMHLVQKLLLHCMCINSSARASRFRDDAVSVIINFGDRIAKACHAGDILITWVAIVAAGHLGAAFQQMSGQVARAIRAQSSQAQPKCASAGPTARDGSATRPQTTMSPPASNASAMAFAP